MANNTDNLDLDKKLYFENIIEQNYQAIKARGLITDKTDFYDFMEKLEAETKELATEWVWPDFEETKFEAKLIDCLSVLLNLAKHHKIDIIEGLKANIEKNWNLAKHINIEEL